MPSIFSKKVSFERLREIALYFVQTHDADVLLGSAEFPESCKSYIAVNATDELILDADAHAEEIAPAIRNFAFKDNNPTIGYVSYECGHTLREVDSLKKREYPALHFKKYSIVLVHDAIEESLEVLCGDTQSMLEVTTGVEKAGPVPDLTLPHFLSQTVRMSLEKDAYIDGVAQILEYIRDGLTYQLNLSTRFTVPAENLDPVLWFFALSKHYPAPYYAFFRSCEKMIVSTSPELFLRVENGQVTSEPIKGTLQFDEYSEDLEKRLTSSIKEDSELSMIVDLVRNDISADCKYGSVVVEKHKSVFAVDNLLQMYSRVRGELSEDKDCIDLFLDVFPGGSITGCPKRSSMELIEALEPHTRGPYCGSIVLISGPKDLISSIAIRTAVYDREKNELFYWAGSGIVIDSDPEAEYFETLAKAGKIIDPEGM